MSTVKFNSLNASVSNKGICCRDNCINNNSTIYSQIFYDDRSGA